MAKITKHNSKQKRKANNREQRRINLSISWYSIRIDNILKAFCKLTVTIQRRWNLAISWCSQRSDDSGHLKFRISSGFQSSTNIVEINTGTPTFSNQAFAFMIVGQFVQCIINSLFSVDDGFPRLYRAINICQSYCFSSFGILQDLKHNQIMILYLEEVIRFIDSCNLYLSSFQFISVQIIVQNRTH